MDLSQNTTYSNANQAMSSMVDKLSSIGKTMSRAKKTTNTSNYSGLVNNVKSNLGTVTTPYGGSTRYESFHPGVDLANKIGTPVPDFVGGKVVDARSGMSQGSPDFGNYVIVEDNQGNKYRYSHLNKAYVSVGDVVQPGQIIGEMGNSGATYSNSGGTGAHLDFRIQDVYGKYINPNKFIS
jgi:murein DD-endopeptidase MepM/ murein hydrolase activator NlpD